MTTVHHLNNSRSQRVLWLLEELGLPYEIKKYQRNPKTMLAPPELQQVHPLGKSPVITEDGMTIAESGAILEYLVRRHGGGRFAPPDASPDFLRYTYWMHFAEGSAMPPLVMKLVFDKVETAPMPFFIRPIAKGISAKVKSAFIMPNIQRQMDFIEAELGKSEWFAGDDFTAADIQMSYPVEAAASRGPMGNGFPRTRDWLQRIHARPAYLRAQQRGGETIPA